jgi:hypothetical protein
MRILLALVLFATAACTTVPYEPDLVQISKGIWFRIPSPASLTGQMQVVQMIAVNSQDRKLLLEAHLSLTPAQIKLVSLDTLGRRAVTLHWDKDRIDSQAADWLPQEISAKMLAAHIALIYWPEAIIRGAIVGEELSLVETPASRKILQGNKEILTIQYDGNSGNRWQGKAVIKHVRLDYQLVVNSKVLP